MRLSSLRIPLKYGLRLVGIPFCAAGQGLPPVDPAGFPSPYPPRRLGWGGEIPLHDSSPTLLPKDACDFALRRMARLRCFKPCCGNGRRCTYNGRCQMSCVFFYTSRSLLWNTTVRKIAERTVSSGAERGLDSLFHSLVRELLHVVFKKAMNGTASMNVLLRVTLSCCHGCRLLVNVSK